MSGWFLTSGAARKEILHRKVYGAVLLDPQAPRLLVASAAGVSPAQALTALFSARARAGGQDLVITDIRPLPRHDAHGLGPTFLVFGWAIGGYLAGMITGRMLGMRSGSVRIFVLRLAVLAGFAAVSSAATVALVDAGMGILTAHPLALVGIGVLTVFAIGCLSSLLQSLFGLAGTLMSVVIVVLLGNPTSAGAQTPPEMMPAFWDWAAHAMPNAAARNAVFEIEWFGGHGTGAPFTTLALWAAIPILAMVLLLVPGAPKGTHAAKAVPSDGDLLDAQGTSLAVSGGPL